MSRRTTAFALPDHPLQICVLLEKSIVLLLDAQELDFVLFDACIWQHTSTKANASSCFIRRHQDWGNWTRTRCGPVGGSGA